MSMGPAGLPSPVILQGTFTGTGASSSCEVWGNFNVTLGGTWAGSVQVERSFDDGATWTVVAVDGAGNPAIYTSPISLVGQEIEVGADYRLNCTVFTSGTVRYRIAVPQYRGRF